MRIRSIEIENFRAVRRLEIYDLPDMVVIAGPNGCGKSSIFDAIRLIKSIYGGYQPNEFQHWLNEFQVVRGHQRADTHRLMFDPTKALRIVLDIELAPSEIKWLSENALGVAQQTAWAELVPDGTTWRGAGLAAITSENRAKMPEVMRRALEKAPALASELGKQSHRAELTVAPSGEWTRANSAVVETVFGTYEPQHLGLIDYHGAQRTYARELIGGINLSIESTEQRQRQHSLYNSQNKYSNIKSELASEFVRSLLVERAGGDDTRERDLTSTLHELFRTFFPGKEFLGPEISRDGAVSFRVKTAVGAVHDIDDLSSGEKELLYGYLRLRRSAPRNSVLLIDEPELHLNPRLVDGLPEFYNEHLGRALGSQVWLVTHSDGILRQAVGRHDYGVFHMHPATATPENQATAIRADEDVERVVVELVGDLAAYRPGAKLVVTEGGGDTEFDGRLISDLFPEFAAKVNLLSGGNKARVRGLQELLERARLEHRIPVRVYAITDRDLESVAALKSARQYQWDRYHIENYLLEPEFILEVASDLQVPAFRNIDAVTVEAWLKDAAEQTLHNLVRQELQARANLSLTGALSTAIDPTSTDIAAPLFDAVGRARARIDQVLARELSLETLHALEVSRRASLRNDLQDGAWKSTFAGRDILKRFVGRRLAGKIAYESFRDLIAARMRDDRFRPIGMERVLTMIAAD